LSQIYCDKKRQKGLSPDSSPKSYIELEQATQKAGSKFAVIQACFERSLLGIDLPTRKVQQLWNTLSTAAQSPPKAGYEIVPLCLYAQTNPNEITLACRGEEAPLRLAVPATLERRSSLIFLPRAEIAAIRLRQSRLLRTNRSQRHEKEALRKPVNVIQEGRREEDKRLVARKEIYLESLYSAHHLNLRSEKWLQQSK
jgi:hypothetical protein